MTGIANVIAQRLADIYQRLGENASVGEMRLMPFRAGNLPRGWYIVNGDIFPSSSPQGQALLRHPDSYKEDWGITETADGVSLPSVFDDSGYGMFFRPADGVNRQPGDRQTDAIRNIEGSTHLFVTINKNYSYADGPLTGTVFQDNMGFSGSGSTGNAIVKLGFDASTVVPTASENRPKNRGMIAAIFLGV